MTFVHPILNVQLITGGHVPQLIIDNRSINGRLLLLSKVSKKKSIHRQKRPAINKFKVMVNAIKLIGLITV